jgi:hypothetical protein
LWGSNVELATPTNTATVWGGSPVLPTDWNLDFTTHREWREA